MERKEIISNLKRDGAWYRMNGIIFAASKNMCDEETIKLLRSLKSNTVWMLGRQVGWYAIAALDMLGAEKYTGNDPDIAQFVSEFPADVRTVTGVEITAQDSE